MTNNETIIHLASSLSKKAGGVQTSLIGMTNQLSAIGTKVELWSFKEKELNAESESFRNPVRLFDSPPLFLFPFSNPLSNALAESPNSILHLHGLWEFPSLSARNWPKSKPRILSPHGMLEPWALQNSAWKKKIALFLYEKNNLKSSSCFHALCRSEAESIRSLGFQQPIAVIPNGVNLPDLKKQIESKQSSPRTLLYLGRLHKKKNLLVLISAWKSLPKTLKKDWQLRIVGWGDHAYKTKLTTFLAPDILLEGPIYGQEKEMAFRKASGFIHPSHSEGLPMAILEAWSYELPVLMSKECNLPEGFEASAAVVTGTDQAKINRALEHFLKMSDSDKATMGTNGRKLVEDRFTWPIVASKMASVYQWLLNKGPKPECVIDK